MNKNMQKKVLVVSLLFSLLIIGEGCETKSQTGGLFGAGTGALIGSSIAGGRNKTAGAVIGAVLGAAVGSEIGRYMDEQDKMKARETSQRAMEYSRSGATSSWRNPDSGHSGTITPRRAYQNSDGQYCREYTQTVTIGGKTEKGYGTACRQPDGQWQIISD